MASAAKRKSVVISDSKPLPRYGSEEEVEKMTGFSRRTLQKHRLLGQNLFPYYKAGKKVLYNLDEVAQVLARMRHDGGGAAA